MMSRGMGMMGGFNPMTGMGMGGIAGAGAMNAMPTAAVGNTGVGRIAGAGGHVAGAGVVHEHEGHAAAHSRGVAGCDLAVVEAGVWCDGDVSVSLMIVLAAWCCFHFNLGTSSKYVRV
ncbi:hypothetical protein V8E53_000714 [Lactarius tabidus]